jgi:uncharacterized circularly permuted ATP-grasp superfamily protein/uncharacterized alpha-E superfamily protein
MGQSPDFVTPHLQSWTPGGAAGRRFRHGGWIADAFPHLRRGSTQVRNAVVGIVMPMSATVPELSSPIIDAYRAHPARGCFDELVTDTGVRAQAEALSETIESMGRPGLLAAREAVRNQVAADGISHGAGGADGARNWVVDPLPLPLAAAEWSTLETGLAQRARLLDAVLTDLYSDRTLLRRKLLPPAAILAHPGFARSVDGTLDTNRPNLMLTATDLGRDASGNWLAISDRTQTPTGAAWAMANRRVVSKVLASLHRRSDLARLRGFFLSLTGTLLDAAPDAAETPRVVLLSPGTGSRSAFDHGFLATLLGFPLAEADDLVVSQGRVWLRAGDGLAPVDVILRRVDDALADPLEFRSDSEIGVPGLIEATRRRQVTVANPVGVAVLDNPALIAYLPRLCTELLGEELQLASAQTWWCGERSGRQQVLTNLERLVIKPVARQAGIPVRYGWLLSEAERAELVSQIQAEPWAWCGQEPIELSTAPVVTSAGLEPRRFVLRSFGVSTSDGYRFLPGGLGRVAGSIDSDTVSRVADALAKDVWVPAAAQLGSAELARPRLSVARQAAVPPRVARTLMRIGRLAERAESTARLLKVADDLAEDFGSHAGSSGAAALSLVLRAVSGITGCERDIGESNIGYLARITLDEATPGGVHHSVSRLIAEAQEVRDLLSVDIWSIFNRLERTLATEPADSVGLQQLLADVLESLLAYAGVMAQSMVRDSSWAFLDAGCRVERAAHTVKLLRYTLVTEPRSVPVHGPWAELAAEAVLRAGESIITHRRRLAAGTGPGTGWESVLDLLVHDQANPRSVAYQLVSLVQDLRLIDDAKLAAQAEAIAEVVAKFVDADQTASAAHLEQLAASLAGLTERVSARHFTRQATRRAAETTWAVD